MREVVCERLFALCVTMIPMGLRQNSVMLLKVTGPTLMGAMLLAGARVEAKATALPMASIVVVDVSSGKVLQRSGELDAASLPGSTLKPLLLMTALRSHTVGEHETVACRGTLTAAGHNLACSHPRDVTVLDARQALANSCNAYFAALARRMPVAVMMDGLRSYGIGVGKTPRDGDERVLTALGLQGVSVSPMQMVGAYRKLAAEMNAEAAGAGVVRDGMVQSVETGMAHAARVEGVGLGGKTGTVDEGGGRSHGWFAGIIFDGQSKARRVVVILVLNGNGNDAALVARGVVKAKRGSK